MLKRLLSFLGQRPKRTLIRDLRVGEVACIQGDALSIDAPLPAPFSGTECAALTVMHQQEQTVPEGARVSPGWPVREFVFRRGFHVRDESGLVRVELRNRTEIFGDQFAKTTGTDESRAASLMAFRDSFRPSNDEEEEMLAAFEALMSVDYLIGYEVTIAEGARVRIEGLVRSTGELLPGDAAVGFRDAPIMLELVAPPKSLRITRIKRS